MDMIFILLRQILQMFLLSGIGFALYKGKKITDEGCKTLGNILIYLALPAVIINGFLVERTTAHMLGFLYSAAAALILLLLSSLTAKLFFRKDAVAAFGSAFSNPGFFGVPLIIATAGQGAVFYVACFIAFLNVGQWTYGVSLLNGQPVRRGFQPKRLIRAPFVIAILIGLFLFFARIQLPAVLSGYLSTVASLNTPLAMFTIGVYLAQTNLGKMVKKPVLYKIAAVRLLLIPVLSMLLLALLPQELHDMKIALLLAASCPVGSNVAVYAQIHGKDYAYAVETVAVSTLFSILTIPGIVWLAQMVW